MENASTGYDTQNEDQVTEHDEKDFGLSLLEKQGTARKIKGVAASLGVTEGPATVLADTDNLTEIAGIKEGAVLVCKTASPNLSLIIQKIKAIVTDCGGTMATASRFAREHGVPAVVSATGITGIVRNGDIVRVNGTKGTVEILRRGRITEN